jgi:cytochrome c oxidase assembly protein Cox11
MPPKLRILLRIAVAFVVIFFAIQPYNWFCQLSQNCKPFYLSYYIPKKEGTKQIKIDLETTNYKRDVKFFVDKPEIITVANKKIVATYTITNNSKKLLRVRPKMEVIPKEATDYIKTYQCICLKRYKLKPKQTITIQMEFEIDKDIESADFIDQILENSLKIRFRL